MDALVESRADLRSLFITQFDRWVNRRVFGVRTRLIRNVNWHSFCTYAMLLTTHTCVIHVWVSILIWKNPLCIFCHSALAQMEYAEIPDIKPQTWNEIKMSAFRFPPARICNSVLELFSMNFRLVGSNVKEFVCAVCSGSWILGKVLLLWHGTNEGPT